MQRIETLAFGFNRQNAIVTQGFLKHLQNESDTNAQRFDIGSVFRGVHRTLEVVQHRQQIFDDIAHCAVTSFAFTPRRLTLVIFKIGGQLQNLCFGFG